MISGEVLFSNLFQLQELGALLDENKLIYVSETSTILLVLYFEIQSRLNPICKFYLFCASFMYYEISVSGKNMM